MRGSRAQHHGRITAAARAQAGLWLLCLLTIAPLEARERCAEALGAHHLLACAAAAAAAHAEPAASLARCWVELHVCGCGRPSWMTRRCLPCCCLQAEQSATGGCSAGRERGRPPLQPGVAAGRGGVGRRHDRLDCGHLGPNTGHQHHQSAYGTGARAAACGVGRPPLQGAVGARRGVVPLAGQQGAGGWRQHSRECRGRHCHCAAGGARQLHSHTAGRRRRRCRGGGDLAAHAGGRRRLSLAPRSKRTEIGAQPSGSGQHRWHCAGRCRSERHFHWPGGWQRPGCKQQQRIRRRRRQAGWHEQHTAAAAAASARRAAARVSSVPAAAATAATPAAAKASASAAVAAAAASASASVAAAPAAAAAAAAAAPALALASST